MSNFNQHRPRLPYKNNYSPWRTPPEQQSMQSPLPLLVPAPNIPTAHGFAHRYPLNQPLEKHLPYRLWSNTTYQDVFRRDHQEHFKFHLVCYNILSQNLLEDNSFLYQNCYKNNLKWYKRKDRLLRELLRQDADILFTRNARYDSIYIKRSGDKFDGCCLFYRRNRLKLVDSKAVSFYRSDVRILNKDNCGLIALFQPLTQNASEHDLFCVATTHLLFSPKRGDIKLAQVQYFLAEIDRLASKPDEPNLHYPIILCGDLNAQPLCPLINFLLSGYLQYNGYTCIQISGQTPALTMSNSFSYPLPSQELLPSSFVTSDCRFPSVKFHNPTFGVLTHNKQFVSVYDLNDISSVTSGVTDESKTVDYIFYSQQNNDPYRLNLLSRLNLYNQNQMVDVHIPNHQFPSDHFLLGAKFALKLKQ
ncbi:unnamed protein product [Adineta ricciae]|uniref:Endonuclease/exonuclease/phosphatase domain-containing protein n=1 Tax=Adineta ricciae TaxID=249248 RepID=A0A815K0F5_ADIRI|nr:unnamed protein product [Adineta ricciae]